MDRWKRYVAAYAVLGHPADKYAAKRAEMAARPARKAEYLL